MNKEYLQKILYKQIIQLLEKADTNIDVSGFLAEYAMCGGKMKDELEKLLCQQITLLTEQLKDCANSNRLFHMSCMLVNLVSACRSLLSAWPHEVYRRLSYELLRRSFNENRELRADELIKIAAVLDYDLNVLKFENL